MINRRHFLHLTGAGLTAAALRPLGSWAPSSPTGPAIERITILRVPGAFYRPIAMNAYDRGPKGQDGTIHLVRVFLEDGTMGLGVGGYAGVGDEVREGLRQMIGVAPMDVYTWQNDRITGFAPAFSSFFTDRRFAFFETPLLDAVGHLTGRPVYALFGDPVRDEADAYDGTLYFKDVELETDASIIGELARRIQTDGYGAIKMKVGRASKWMPGEAGLERDIEAVIAAREAVGNNFNLMIDANNGYRNHYDWALRFLEALVPYDVYWAEELFPEDEATYRQLHDAMHARGFHTRIAEGEDAVWSTRAAVQTVDGFEPWLEQGLFDVIQPDMRSVGFTNTLAQARMAEAHGAELVPHNWQSELGKLMSIHLARLQRNVDFVEDDRWANHALDTTDYLFREGRWLMPEAPGWGVRLSGHYDRLARATDEVVIS